MKQSLKENADQLHKDLISGLRAARTEEAQQEFLRHIRTLASLRLLADRDDYQIGEPVTVSGEYEADWRGITLYIQSVSLDVETGRILYSVSERYPPTSLGDITTDFKHEDLVRFVPSPDNPPAA